MIDPSYLKSLFVYDPETGIFTHTAKKTSSRRAGKVAGSFSPTIGRWMLSVGARRNKCCLFQASRAAWVYMTGENPIAIVEHIDGDCLNNRWANLRLATQSQNCANKGVRSDSTLGVKGVVPHRRKDGSILGYEVRTVREGKNFYGGYFSDVEKAQEVYQSLVEREFGEFARIS
jgi:hypothetical protein